MVNNINRGAMQTWNQYTTPPEADNSKAVKLMNDFLNKDRNSDSKTSEQEFIANVNELFSNNFKRSDKSALQKTFLAAFTKLEKQYQQAVWSALSTETKEAILNQISDPELKDFLDGIDKSAVTQVQNTESAQGTSSTLLSENNLSLFKTTTTVAGSSNITENFTVPSIKDGRVAFQLDGTLYNVLSILADNNKNQEQFLGTGWNDWSKDAPIQAIKNSGVITNPSGNKLHAVNVNGSTQEYYESAYIEYDIPQYTTAEALIKDPNFHLMFCLEKADGSGYIYLDGDTNAVPQDANSNKIIFMGGQLKPENNNPINASIKNMKRLLLSRQPDTAAKFLLNIIEEQEKRGRSSDLKDIRPRNVAINLKELFNKSTHKQQAAVRQAVGSNTGPIDMAGLNFSETKAVLWVYDPKSKVVQISGNDPENITIETPATIPGQDGLELEATPLLRFLQNAKPETDEKGNITKDSIEVYKKDLCQKLGIDQETPLADLQGAVNSKLAQLSQNFNPEVIGADQTGTQLVALKMIRDNLGELIKAANQLTGENSIASNSRVSQKYNSASNAYEKAFTKLSDLKKEYADILSSYTDNQEATAVNITLNKDNPSQSVIDANRLAELEKELAAAKQQLNQTKSDLQNADKAANEHTDSLEISFKLLPKKIKTFSNVYGSQQNIPLKATIEYQDIATNYSVEINGTTVTEDDLKFSPVAINFLPGWQQQFSAVNDKKNHTFDTQQDVNDFKSDIVEPFQNPRGVFINSLGGNLANTLYGRAFSQMLAAMQSNITTLEQATKEMVVESLPDEIKANLTQAQDLQEKFQYFQEHIKNQSNYDEATKTLTFNNVSDSLEFLRNLDMSENDFNKVEEHQEKMAEDHADLKQTIQTDFATWKNSNTDDLPIALHSFDDFKVTQNGLDEIDVNLQAGRTLPQNPQLNGLEVIEFNFNTAKHPTLPIRTLEYRCWRHY